MKQISFILLGLLVVLQGCDGGSDGGNTSTSASSGSDKPNILWIVWDTVRRDHMSVYGYERPTTPYLENWAKGARVYENCVSPGSTTVPSHASMFTGLLPSEHGASNAHPQLDSRFETIAERLKGGGYDTYLFAANPHLTREHKFAQGFDEAEHPWSPTYRERALEIVTGRVDPRDNSSEMLRKLKAGRTNDWTIKTAGVLAQDGVEKWLDAREGGKPYFVFLNYMEAHRPLIPDMKYRKQMMTEEEILKSFEVDRGWPKTWAYTFGQAEYTDEELDLTRKTYDAAVLELDDLFRQLIESLEARGALDNTIVILTSDHGEHLGEHHMLDHQYSLYDVLLEIPLLVHYPESFEAGRDSSPVMSFDIFPTLLRLAGLPQPKLPMQCFDLAEVPERRLRLSEYPRATPGPFRTATQTFGDLQQEQDRWLRSLRALTDSDLKLICGSDGSRELYDINADPGELTNIAESQAERWATQCSHLRETVGSMIDPGRREKLNQMDAQQLKRLEDLGYAGSDEDDEEGDAEEPGIPTFCDCEQ